MFSLYFSISKAHALAKFYKMFYKVILFVILERNWNFQEIKSRFNSILNNWFSDETGVSRKVTDSCVAKIG